MDIKLIHDLADKKKWQVIVDTIERLPKIDLNFDLRMQLARAYNNISDYDEALKVLFSLSEEGELNAYWNFVIGYSYIHKGRYELALKHFKKSFDLGRSDSEEYIEKCKKCINNTKIELKIIADKYKEFGLNISCITNVENDYNVNSRSFFKTPSHSWINLFRLKQNKLNFDCYDWENCVGIGTFTNWKSIVVLDIDGCNDVTFLKNVLIHLGLPQDYEWVVESGSKNGYHIYFRGQKNDGCEEDDVVSTFPPKQEYEKYLDKVEFLWETHTVLPPSAHGSGNVYSFVNGGFPSKLPLWIDSNTIYSFIEKYLDFKEISFGGPYGEEMALVSSKTEFVNDLNEEDFSEYLLDDVYLIIDIETSGIPQKTNSGKTYPEILQIAWVLTNKNGLILRKNSFIIDTPFIRNNESSKFVNIDFKTARKVSFSINYVLEKLTKDIDLCDYIVAHNIEFDLEILEHYYNKIYGVNPFETKKTICTMKSTTNFCKIPNNYGYKYPTLSELFYKLYNYQLNNSHNAEIDVLHTLKCFKKLQRLQIIKNNV